MDYMALYPRRYRCENLKYYIVPIMCDTTSNTAIMPGVLQRPITTYLSQKSYGLHGIISQKIPLENLKYYSPHYV
jgi:hypothetical protein